MNEPRTPPRRTARELYSFAYVLEYVSCTMLTSQILTHVDWVDVVLGYKLRWSPQYQTYVELMHPNGGVEYVKGDGICARKIARTILET